MRDVAHVHDGYQVQTNAVTRNGSPGVLIVVRKSGGSSTLAVIDGTNSVLPELRNLLPAGVTLTPLFDQSIFVKAALNSVVMGGLMAAGLTALMILLFLGNWRLTLIILASIPLSIIAAVLVLYLLGQTLNTMTLGGFALAVGILVDNSTVVIENIERHVGLDKPLNAPSWTAPARSVSRHFCHAVDQRRICSGLPADRHRQVPVLAAVALGHHLALRQPGAVLHPGAGAVQVSYAVAPRPPGRSGARHVRPCPGEQTARSLSASRTDISKVVLKSSARSTATSWLDSRSAVDDGRVRRVPHSIAAAVSVARHGLFSAGRRGADAASRTCSAGNTDRGDPKVFRQRGSGDP